MSTEPRGRDLFVGDSSVSGWTGCATWNGPASPEAFDIGTGCVEISALPGLAGTWQTLGTTRILMGVEATHRTRKAVLDAVRGRAVAIVVSSIEADRTSSPLLDGVPAILDGRRHHYPLLTGGVAPTDRERLRAEVEGASAESGSPPGIDRSPRVRLHPGTPPAGPGAR